MSNYNQSKFGLFTSVVGKLVLLGGVLMIFMVCIGGCFVVGANNDEVSLRNRAEAQQEVCEATFDTMWKIIQTKAQVAEQYKDSFAAIYPELIAGRYGGDRGGALMSWIQESNPNFDTALYRDVSNSIESERHSFLEAQRVLLDIKREHDNLRQQFPSSLIVGSRPELEVEIITSSRTESVYEAGTEDDISVFPQTQTP